MTEVCWHVVAGRVVVAVEGASASDRAAVSRRLGPAVSSPGTAADLTLRFVPGLPSAPLTMLGLDAGWVDDAFHVLVPTREGVRRAVVPLDRVGAEATEVVCETGIGEVPLLTQLVNLVALGKGLLPLHAAALVWEGRGSVLTGWAKGGKTEAVLACAPRGAKVVGDEWVYLQPGGPVTGFPEQMHVWDWHLAELAASGVDVPASARRRVAVGRFTKALPDRLPARVRSGAVGSAARLIGRAGEPLRGVDLDPEELFGPDVRQAETSFDQLFLVTSSERPDTTVTPIDGREVADRMVASLRYEQRPLLDRYDAFRFAFPDRVNPLIDAMPDLQRERLHSLLPGRPAFRVDHPYPVSLADLFAALAPHL
jgi:hypothetical protein